VASAAKLAWVWASISLGCAPQAFACNDDAQCGANGLCEPQGWCSFPDHACSTGRRFGAHAGGGLAERCVPTGEGTSGGGSSGSSDPSIASSLDATMPGSSSADDDGTSVLPSSSGAVDDTASTDTGSTGEPVDPDLLLWLSFDDASAPFADGSGNGLDAECVDEQCPSLEAGRVGTAARLDGIDDRLRLLDIDALATPDALTLALWIDVDAVGLASYQDVLTKTLGSGSFNSFGLGFPNTVPNLRLVMHDGTALTHVGEVAWPRRGGWHHVAATWDGALARLYLDGIVVGEAPHTALGVDEHPVLIGADINAELEGNYTAGALDEVRMYRRALAEDEILALVGQ
jgi:Concanavalin A-like lectin/glucanases superfamily